ncbi:MAG: hypothetical protein JW709_10835 [Sedimentisphaerales bacterium]|nr:hypothetical protein [Sedimentisphaerales bacterium]
MKRCKKLLARWISLLPTSYLRVAAYNMLPGYAIKNSTIGLGTRIVADRVEITGAHIGKHNLFYGPMKVTIDNGARIGSNNRFICEDWTAEAREKNPPYERTLTIGSETLITAEHYFDVAGALSIGDKTWIAGRGSQFWTHGAGVGDRNIHIGENCYIGSAVRFAPGSRIQNHVLVAMGSVVAGVIPHDNVLVGGVPARIIKENYHWTP